MFTRTVLIIFSWALILETLVLVYYLLQSIKPLEFYMNIGLMVFTILSLTFLILKEIRRRDEDDKHR